VSRQALVAITEVGHGKRRSTSVAAEAAFRQRLAALGATLLESDFLGTHQPHRVRCASGHECRPRPGDVRRGRGICLTCAVRNPLLAEAQFRRRLSALGATPLFDSWLGANRPHHVRCAAGHDCWTSPANVRRGWGVCKPCAGNDTMTAESSFRATLAELGATPLFANWQGVRQPHLVRCPEGHDCCPWPSNVARGQGICRACGGKTWDAFYVATSRLAVKFGITSGGGRPRLSLHARHGYTTVVRLATDLPGTLAFDTESAVRSALAMASELPVKGREYFDISCLGLVLDVADPLIFRKEQS
jgi:hypothetical protein